jgi:hypothetical protein
MWNGIPVTFVSKYNINCINHCQFQRSALNEASPLWNRGNRQPESDRILKLVTKEERSNSLAFRNFSSMPEELRKSINVWQPLALGKELIFSLVQNHTKFVLVNQYLWQWHFPKLFWHLLAKGIEFFIFFNHFKINIYDNIDFISCADTCLPNVSNSSSSLTLSIELSLAIALSIGVILDSDVRTWWERPLAKLNRFLGAWSTVGLSNA